MQVSRRRSDLGRYATACLGAGSRTRRRRRAAATGCLSDEAEVVMGTLTAPPSRRFLARIRSGKMGGVIFLGNDWLTRSKVGQITAELQQAACTRGEPLLIALDQEGGIVKRLAWAPPTEAPADMTSAADVARAGGGSCAGIPLSRASTSTSRPSSTPRARRATSSARAPSPHSPQMERAMAKAFVARPAAERHRGDGEALPRPRPRRAGTPTTAASRSTPRSGRSSRDCCRSRRDQGGRQARDGRHRDLSAPRRIAQAGGVLEHDHQRILRGSSSASRA